MYNKNLVKPNKELNLNEVYWSFSFFPFSRPNSLFPRPKALKLGLFADNVILTLTKVAPSLHVVQEEINKFSLMFYYNAECNKIISTQQKWFSMLTKLNVNKTRLQCKNYLNQVCTWDMFLLTSIGNG